jgi:alpha-glucosidase
MKINKILLFFYLFFISLSLFGQQIQRIQFKGTGTKPLILTLECWDDDLIHFRFGDDKTNGKMFVNTTPSIAKTDYTGANEFQQNGNTVETKDLKIVFNPYSFTVTMIDKQQKDLILVTFTPTSVDGNWRGFRAYKKSHTHFFGLGQQFDFSKLGSVEFDWNGKKRIGGKHGNEMVYANGGATGNTQLPILYALHSAKFENYAVLYDNEYKQRWDFSPKHEWTAEADGGEVDFFFFHGKDLKDLRKDFMELTGRPPIPPKKMFGLWVSEFGYDNWAEVDEKLNSLQKNKFPVDGFVMDLQWFGGIKPEDSQMGKLDWDTKNFPDPKTKILQYDTKNGIGIMTIEEAYVAKSRPEFDQMAKLGLLASYALDRKNFFVLPKAWWGAGGMFDYTNPQTQQYIHQTKRLKLINDGVIGHWCDLGEPENYNDSSIYVGGYHKDIHNLFGFKWLQGIAEGYKSSKIIQRPFVLARSGAIGMQRYGAALWSGDISSRMTSLAAQTAGQANMAFSGIDYYGSDIGGFHRFMDTTVRVDLQDSYTRWYAYGTLCEIPVRPHTSNVDEKRQNETAPDKIGDVPSNLANTRLRYALTPYLYSLAYKAYTIGEPIIAPLVYHYQTDKHVNNLGDHKMIGEFLLTAASTVANEKTKDVYLPQGTWFDFYTNKVVKGRANFVNNIALYRNGLFKLPLYAKAGAIIPMMYVDEQTMNILGKRTDNSIHNELIIKVFADENLKEFLLYEDDGKTVYYQQGDFRTTVLEQSGNKDEHRIHIGAAKGNYNMEENRNCLIELITPKSTKGINVNGVAIKAYSSRKELDENPSGFVQEKDGIIIKTKTTKVNEEQKIVVVW